MRRFLAAAAFTLVLACSGSSGRATTTSTTTTGIGDIPAQSADPTATDADNGGRAFARLYAAGVRQQANGAVDDTQTQCIEDQLIATFGGARLLQLSNTTYRTMPPADLQQLVKVLQGCGLTPATLETLGVTDPST